VDIESRTKRSLEWDRLKAYLEQETSCAGSQALCAELAVHDELAVVDILLTETDEALSMERGGFSLSQPGLPELAPTLDRLRAGGQLSTSELVDLRRLLAMSKRSRSQLSQLAVNDFPRLTLFPKNLFVDVPLAKAIDDVIDEAGNVRDDASSELFSLRKDVGRLNNQIKEEMLRIINSSTLSKALQEPLFTQRNGRYVLPVQASSRQQIQGIVHDSSASGLTVYIEPLNVVELSNKIRLKESEIEREIDRLLSQLTEAARPHVEALSQSNTTLIELDFIAARARLAAKYKGVRPALSKDQAIVFKSARHPLLMLQNQGAENAVVANDIVLGGTTRTLVITGPNTGGKTVFLKTAGLLALMLKAGLLLPVQPGSSACVFKQVFADIGDEQSLEQSLSTFSSHMTNIVDITNLSGDLTLALLDEIGAGTDPKEGSILARVILEFLNLSGALTIATTHYGELKTLAYGEAGFVNGSFEFDEQTLSPTYKLRIGIPGNSKAITIASRLGLKVQLIDSANQFLGASETDAQQLMEQMQRRLEEIDQQQEALGAELAAAQNLKDEAAAQLASLQAEREKQRAGFANRLQEEFSQASKLVKSLISDLQKTPSIAKAQQIQQDLEVLKKELGWLEPAKPEGGPPAIAVGMAVKVLSLNQKGIIEALPEPGKSEVSVRAGNVKIKVPISDLQITGHGTHTGVKSAGTGGGSTQHRSASMGGNITRIWSDQGDLNVFVRTARNTIDLRGQRVDEALANLEQFIDEAFLERLSPVMVIHGHGTGRVREAVRQYLKDSQYNAKFRPGENYEGGNGVTIVNFG
jgi:DNA mismatch repair protein MutS2